ncbi:MAG TPA: dephospho-CoA kinase [Puia sp.]|jgi:dephospho-CoA kinase|nr:dephospho-CoA kinase [Puia sp.]
MLKIGLTGGIGSGKTTVAQIFEVLAIPVYYADQAAKDLMNQDPELKKQIISAFGREVYKEGVLDRSYLGGIVFADAEKLSLLNSFVHPVTFRDASSWMQNQKTSYAVKEAALIFEAGLEDFFDYIIGVTAPESLRLERVMNRDHTSKESVLQRMAQQMDEKEKISRCDFVIINNEKQALLPQVLEIHKTLLTKANEEKV